MNDQNRRQIYDKKSGIPEEVVSIEVSKPIADFFNSIDETDLPALNIILSKSVFPYIYNFIETPLKRKFCLDDILFHYLELLDMEGARMEKDEILFFYRLNELLSTCILYQADQRIQKGDDHE